MTPSPSLLRRIYLLAASAQPGNALETCRQIRDELRGTDTEPSIRRRGDITIALEQARETGTGWVFGDRKHDQVIIHNMAKRAGMLVAVNRMRREGEWAYRVTIREGEG